MIEGMLAPEVDEESAPFFDGCAVGELRMQACALCGRFRFPPRPMCPWCRSTEREWRAVSGRGRIWSFVVPHPPLLPAYEEAAPYNVIVVELAEDPTLRLVGNLVDSPDAPINSVDPTSIEVGEPVQVVFSTVGAGEEVVTLPRWVRV